MTELQTGETGLDRRRFLTGAAGVAGLAAGASVAGCGGGKNAAAPNDKAVKAPTLVPYGGAEPDLPAGEHSVPAGYFKYPADPKTFVTDKLGASKPISFLVQGTGMVPAGKNKWLQGVMKRAGTDFKISLIASADYQKKFQVAVAGGDLQDVLQIQTVANMPQVLEKEFSDLSDYLSGDNIKNYPGLASIPTASWSIPTLNGRIWGIPEPRTPCGAIVSTRGDTLKTFGIDTDSPTLKDGQEFLDLCRQLTDHKRGKYAFGTLPTSFILPMMLEMMGAPNHWKIDGGKFVSANETDEMKAALEQITGMWKNRLIHPDAFSAPQSNITWWSGQTTTLYVQDFAGWSGYAKTNPDWETGVLVLPKWQGGGMADKLLGAPGYGDFAGLRKAKPARIKEILRILDYFASPFGTQEYLDVNYGAAGLDYTIKGTDPVPTTRGLSENIGGLAYCGTQLFSSLYVPRMEALIKRQHSYLEKVMPTGVADPTRGLYSQTAATKGATANLNLTNAQSDIIQGRRKLSEWDDVVKTWRQKAGDAMSKEYEQAYEKLHSADKSGG